MAITRSQSKSCRLFVFIRSKLWTKVSTDERFDKIGVRIDQFKRTDYGIVRE